jgi:hypothetical protein
MSDDELRGRERMVFGAQPTVIACLKLTSILKRQP